MNIFDEYTETMKSFRKSSILALKKCDEVISKCENEIIIKNSIIENLFDLIHTFEDKYELQMDEEELKKYMELSDMYYLK